MVEEGFWSAKHLNGLKLWMRSGFWDCAEQDPKAAEEMLERWEKAGALEKVGVTPLMAFKTLGEAEGRWLAEKMGGWIVGLSDRWMLSSGWGGAAPGDALAGLLAMEILGKEGVEGGERFWEGERARSFFEMAKKLPKEAIEERMSNRWKSNAVAIAVTAACKSSEWMANPDKEGLKAFLGKLVEAGARINDGDRLVKHAMALAESESDAVWWWESLLELGLDLKEQSAQVFNAIPLVSRRWKEDWHQKAVEKGASLSHPDVELEAYVKWALRGGQEEALKEALSVWERREPKLKPMRLKELIGEALEGSAPETGIRLLLGKTGEQAIKFGAVEPIKEEKEKEKLFQAACESHSIEAMRALKEAGWAKTSARDAKGRGPISWVMVSGAKGQARAIEELLSRWLDSEERDEPGRSALQRACRGRNATWEAVERLARERPQDLTADTKLAKEAYESLMKKGEPWSSIAEAVMLKKEASLARKRERKKAL